MDCYNNIFESNINNISDMFLAGKYNSDTSKNQSLELWASFQVVGPKREISTAWNFILRCCINLALVLTSTWEEMLGWK
jgi:hypothetical protein